jgi:hypothetical protein
MNWQVSGASLLSDTGAARSSSSSLKVRIFAAAAALLVASKVSVPSFVIHRIHAGNVMQHYANLPSVLGKGRLPLCLGKCGRECSQCCCPSLEAGGEGPPIGDSSLLLSSEIELLVSIVLKG